MLSCLRPSPAQEPETLAAERLEALRKHHWSSVSDAFDAAEEARAVSSLRVCTFNLLAPCYKRLAPGSGSKYKRESQDAALWQERVDATAQFLQQQVLPHVDVLGLQEYWFEQEFEQRFAQAIGPDFEIRTHRRVGDKADGVAFVLRKSRFEMLAEKGYPLTKIGSRVALSLLLQDRIAKQRLLVTVTHLSFPHCDFSRDTQLSQGRTLVREVAEFARQHDASRDVPCIIVGDFNAELSEPSCRLVVDSGYIDAFAVVAATRDQDAFVPGAPGFVSHRNHREEAVGVDHIFFQSGAPRPATATMTEEEERKQAEDRSKQPKTSPPTQQQQPQQQCRMYVSDWYMLPADMDIERWPEEFLLSDHRPVATEFRIVTTDPGASSAD